MAEGSGSKWAPERLPRSQAFLIAKRKIPKVSTLINTEMNKYGRMPVNFFERSLTLLTSVNRNDHYLLIETNAQGTRILQLLLIKIARATIDKGISQYGKLEQTRGPRITWPHQTTIPTWGICRHQPSGAGQPYCPGGVLHKPQKGSHLYPHMFLKG